MAAAVKNMVVGPATLSVGGADLGAIKKDTLKISVEQDIIAMGDNEQFAGTVAVYRRLKRISIKAVLQEMSLANIKAALALTATVGGTNPATLNLDFESGILATAAIVITCAAPRTTAGVAQTRTITATAGVATIKAWEYGVGITAGPNEFPIEIDVLYSDGSGDVAFSDVSA